MNSNVNEVKPDPTNFVTFSLTLGETSAKEAFLRAAGSPGMKRVFQSTIIVAALFQSAECFAADFDYARAIKRIARDIAKLKESYPQLKDFSVTKNLNANQLKISYGYHTHKPEGRGGWTSGVPNPDEDGVWFYIDFHDVNSTAQIHTQPMTSPICIGSKRVSFLSLEGTQTKSVDGAIYKVLEKHGATRCSR